MRKRIYARESRYLASRFSVYNNPAGKLKILLPLFGSRVCLLSLLRGQEREREREVRLSGRANIIITERAIMDSGLFYDFPQLRARRLSIKQ